MQIQIRRITTRLNCALDSKCESRTKIGGCLMRPELFLIFTGGLLGSAHCVGMCGGFALSIGASSTSWNPQI